jgi:hypothetical protein
MLKLKKTRQYLGGGTGPRVEFYSVSYIISVNGLMDKMQKIGKSRQSRLKRWGMAWQGIIKRHKASNKKLLLSGHGAKASKSVITGRKWDLEYRSAGPNAPAFASRRGFVAQNQIDWPRQGTGFHRGENPLTTQIIQCYTNPAAGSLPVVRCRTGAQKGINDERCEDGKCGDARK